MLNHPSAKAELRPRAGVQALYTPEAVLNHPSAKAELRLLPFLPQEFLVVVLNHPSAKAELRQEIICLYGM